MKLKIALIAILLLIIPSLVAALFVPKYGLLDMWQRIQAPKPKTTTTAAEATVSTNGTSAGPSTTAKATGTISGPISPNSLSTEMGSDCLQGQVSNIANCSTAAPTPLGVTGSWKLAFRDEFDAKTFDTAKWATQRTASATPNKPFDEKTEDGLFSPANIVQHYGTAELIIKQEVNDTYQYTTGMLASISTFKYGYYEARLKVPPETGTLSAFWIQNSNDGSRLPPLIEVCKYGLGSQIKPTFNYAWLSNGAAKNYPTDYGLSSMNYSKEFHIYGLLWSPTGVQIFLDGKAEASFATNNTSVIDVPGSIVFSLGIQKGATLATGVKMIVDYIRFWEANPATQ